MRRKLRRMMAMLTASTLLSCTVMGNITTADTAAQLSFDEDGILLDGELIDDVSPVSYIPTVSYVDEFGEALTGPYTDISLPFFEEELILDDAAQAPVDDIEVRVGSWLWQQRTAYSYIHAMADDAKISAIRKTPVVITLADPAADEATASNATESNAVRSGATGSNASRSTPDNAEKAIEVETEVYEYTRDGKSWTEITEDTELLFVFEQEGLPSYVYEDEDITVTAHLQEKDALPAGVELKVTPITEDAEGYNYNAYMQALNDNAAKLAESEEDVRSYSKNNTLLYDIAFMMKDADGAEREYEPKEGSVRITTEFRRNQLSGTLGVKSAEEVEVIHLPLKEEVKNAAGSTKDAVEITAADVEPEKLKDASAQLQEGSKAAGSTDGTEEAKESVEFTTDSFSAFAITYTVDFTYDGYTWSFPGQGSHALTEVLPALGIAGEVKDASLKLVKGKELAGALYLTEQDGAWFISSDRAFTDTYELTVNTPGANYVITVTDDAAANHEVTVKFLNRDKTAPVTPSFSEKHYIFAVVTDSEDNVVGYGIQPITLNNSTVSTTISEFKAVTVTVNSEGEEEYDESGETIAFVPAEHDISVRLIEIDSGSLPQTYEEHKSGFKDGNYSDTLDGFTFMSNEQSSDKLSSVITVHEDYEKDYFFHFEFDPELPSITEGDKYYLFISTQHETTGMAYMLEKIVSNGNNPLELALTNDLWKDRNGNQKTGEKFTGKENLSIQILRAKDNNLRVTQVVDKNGYSIVPEGGNVKDYSLSYDITRNSEEVGERLRVTDTIKLKKISAESEYNAESVLGPGIRYGITAEHLWNQQHMQTTIAVNHFTGKDSIAPNLTGNNPGTMVIAEFNQLNQDASTNTGWKKGLFDNSGTGEIADTAEEGGQLHIGGTNGGTLYAYVDDNTGDSREKVKNTANTIVVETNGENLSETVVEPIINYVKDISAELAKKNPTFALTLPADNESSELVIDTTGFGDQATIYIDGDKIPSKYLTEASKLNIVKKDGQTIVFNFDETEMVKIHKYNVNGNGVTAGGSDSDYQISKHIIWNLSNVKSVYLEQTVGVFLMPVENSETCVGSTGGGWIVSDGYVHNSGGEWHNYYKDMPSTEKVKVDAKKTIDSVKYPTLNQVFDFILERYTLGESEEAGYEWKKLQTAQNEGVAVEFEIEIGNYSEGCNIYRITESAEIPSTTVGEYKADNAVYYAAVICKTEGLQTKLSSPRYFSKFEESEYKPKNSDGSINYNITGLSEEITRTVPAFNNTTQTDTGDLELSKTVVSDAAADANQEFTFTVTLSDTTIGGTYGSMTFTNGKAEVKLKGGESAKAEGLPTGINYKVTEATVAGFTADKKEAIGTISKTGSRAAFTNTRETGSLKVTKTVKSDAAADKRKEFSFKVTLSDTTIGGAEGKAYSDMTFKNGVAEFKLKHGESKTAEGLPTGVGYTVVETDNDGFAVTKDGDTGTISKNESEAKIVNTAKTGEITFGGQKSLEGRDLTDKDVFTFAVMEGDKKIVTAENGADGKISYPTIKYTWNDCGEHIYKIKEISTSEKGVSVDTKEYSIKVTVADDGGETLKVTADGNVDKFDFINTYAATGDITFGGTKKIEGRELGKGDIFKFSIQETTEGIEKPYKAEAESDASGKINYPTIRYTKDAEKDDTGTHTYTVKESSKDGKGITVDTSTYTVTVDVKDNGDGTLKIASSSNASKLDFVNTYKASGSNALKAYKTLEGREIEEGEFTFRLTDEAGKVLQEKTNGPADKTTGRAEVSFDAISYTEKDAGQTYTYYITEATPDNAEKAEDGNWTKDGYTYDGHSEKVTVTVTDNKDGTLTIETKYDSGEVPVFANTYEANGDVTFGGTKKLEGRDMTEDDIFKFTVMEGETQIAEVENDAGGKISYPKISYVKNAKQDDTGRHTYTVKEASTGGKGITVDSTTYTVTVDVTDNGDGTLGIASSSNASKLDFVNTYKASGSNALKAYKTLEGREIEEGKFSFRLTDESGEVLQEKKNGPADKTTGRAEVSFDAISYTEADAGQTYTYYITEATPDNAEKTEDGNWTKDGYTYDGHREEVKVSVTDDGDGTLTIDTTYVSGGEAVFENTYSADGTITFEAEKKMEGGSLNRGDFTFTVREGDPETGVIVATGSNAAAESGKTAKISFTNAEDFVYTLDDVGKTYTYYISEDIPEDAVKNSDGTYEKDDVIYDTTVVKVTVTDIADKGDGTITAKVNYPDGGRTFTNRRTEKTQVHVRKVWRNATARTQPASVTIRLVADGKDTGRSLTLSEDNGWSGSFDGLQVKTDGKAIVYTVTEDTVSGYSTSIAKDGDDYSFVVTNTRHSGGGGGGGGGGRRTPGTTAHQTTAPETQPGETVGSTESGVLPKTGMAERIWVLLTGGITGLIMLLGYALFLKRRAK